MNRAQDRSQEEPSSAPEHETDDRRGGGLLTGICRGALAGFVATVPMTVAMELMHRQLPPHERYPLPPREIAMEVAEEAGVKEQMGEPESTGLTLAAHFGYGAAVGALYAPLARKSPLPPALGGAAYGFVVWAGSYLGLLPAMDILRPATEHPPRRNALMITAHLIWGAAAGVLLDRLEKE